MYGVLLKDGTFQELPSVDSASIEGDELICRDKYDRVVARYRLAEAVFGKHDALKRIAPFFRTYRPGRQDFDGAAS